MARLIEASERRMGFMPARGWEDGELDMVRQGYSCLHYLLQIQRRR
jgi:hypothetical protein